MNDKRKTALKWVGGVVGASIAGIALMLSATMLAHPAISSLAGLAVAQTATLWNNVKDANAGDGLSSGILAQGTMVFNGLSFDRVRGDITNGMDVDVTRISGTLTPSDAFVNPTTVSNVWVLNSLFNGTTWDRIRSATADALASTGVQAVSGMLFNGTTFDRWDGVSATNNTGITSVGAAQVANLSTWSVTNTPAAAIQATASKAAGGGTVRHVATGVTWCVAAGATPQAVLLIHLRDGATGAGTILRSWAVSTIASTSECENLSGLNMTGSANTAMTLETAGALSATVQGTVTLTGYSTP